MIDKWVGVALVIYAVTLHELGHAWVATWCGDPTPGKHGRLTFNPLVQLHPVYSVVFPIVTYLYIGYPLGWAFCPIDPSRFRRPLRDRAVTALAGPVVNFLVVFICLGAMWLIWLITNNTLWISFSVFFGVAIWNLILGIFNLLPFPGLDGYDVIRPALPLGIRRPLDEFRSMGFLPLFLAIFLGSRLFWHVFLPLLGLLLSVIPGGPQRGQLLEHWFPEWFQAP